MEYEKVFTLISKSVETFVKKHNLIIEKYRYESPSWMLCFKRKAGGVGYIYINYLYTPDDEKNEFRHVRFEFVIFWILDDYDTEIRHSIRKRIGIFNYDGNSSKVGTLLDQCVNVFKALTYKNLKDHNKIAGWKEHWKNKQDFINSIKYPLSDI